MIPIHSLYLKHCRLLILSFFALLTAFNPFLSAKAQLSERPIRWIVPFSPGGGTDIAARIYAPEMSRLLERAVIIDNRPGAAGAIGVDLCAQSAPDGHTLCLISASHAINSASNPNLPYDLTSSLRGISQITAAFLVLVINSHLPATQLKDFITQLQTHPGSFNFGSSGTGGISHLAGVLFSRITLTQSTHIPYRGEAAALTDLLGGSTQFQFASPLNAGPHISSGRLKALAVTGKQRSTASPELPTLSELGLKGYEVSQWYGVVATRKSTQIIVQTLSDAINKAGNKAELNKRLRQDGLEPVTNSPALFDHYIKSEVTKWKDLIHQSGLNLK